MKNLGKKISGLLFILLCGIVANSQTDEKKYATLLLEFEENITSKAFLKAWKSDKKEWEVKCSKASTVKEITDLTMQLSSACYQYRQVKPMLVTHEDTYAQSGALITLNSIMNEDLEKWDETSRSKWKENLESLRLEIEEKERTKRIEERNKHIADVLHEFEDKFKLILEDSKKGSFANTIEGDKKDDTYDVKVKFSEGSDAKIVVDGDNIYTYVVKFNTKNDQELALELFAKMTEIIGRNLPEGFEKSIKYDGAYWKKQANYFELKAERFALTAKQPSVLIGVLKDLSSIELYIHEPVFKK